MKRSLFLVCLLIAICLLCACTYIEESDAKALAEEYFSLLEAEKFDELISKSDLFIQDRDLPKEFERLEAKTGLDFQSGIAIKEYTAFEAHHSDSYYGKPLCNLTMKAVVGETDTEIQLLILEHEGELKVCRIYIYLDDECYEIS